MLMNHKLFVQLDSVCLCGCLLIVVPELCSVLRSMKSLRHKVVSCCKVQSRVFQVFD